MIYNTKPKNFFPDIECVACMVKYDDKFVLLHRQDNKIHGNKWGQPGGKIDKDDLNIIEAIRRELREETGIEADKKDLLFYKTFFVSHSDRDFLYHYFILDLKEKSVIVLSNKEHKDFSWVTADEALLMPLIPDEDHCIKDYYGIE